MLIVVAYICEGGEVPKNSQYLAYMIYGWPLMIFFILTFADAVLDSQVIEGKDYSNVSTSNFCKYFLNDDYLFLFLSNIYS